MSAPDGCARCREGFALDYREGMPDAEISAYLMARCDPCLGMMAADHRLEAQQTADAMAALARVFRTRIGEAGLSVADYDAPDSYAAWTRERAAILAVSGTRMIEAINGLADPHRRIADLAGAELRRRERES